MDTLAKWKHFRCLVTVGYLASKDLERMCRQFTTAPASVPGDSNKRVIGAVLLHRSTMSYRFRCVSCADFVTDRKKVSERRRCFLKKKQNH